LSPAERANGIARNTASRQRDIVTETPYSIVHN
jgi:hypothetical protein